MPLNSRFVPTNNNPKSIEVSKSSECRQPAISNCSDKARQTVRSLYVMNSRILLDLEGGGCCFISDRVPGGSEQLLYIIQVGWVDFPKIGQGLNIYFYIYKKKQNLTHSANKKYSLGSIL